MNGATIFEAVRHFTYFHPLGTLAILAGVLLCEIAAVVCDLRRKLRNGGPR